jgi:hypothetical protein
LTDLLKQELPQNESRQQTETVHLQSPKKDMESVLTLLPQEKEFITDDGLSGTLQLRLDTVQVEPSGYESSTKEVVATRSYPNLGSRDVEHIPKIIQDDGRTLKLKNVDWNIDNTGDQNGYAMGDRFTAFATYTTTATSSYVKGYTVTADYVGTVSHIALDRVRYVAIYEGNVIYEEEETTETAFQFKWRYVLIPVGIIALLGGGITVAIVLKRRNSTT